MSRTNPQGVVGAPQWYFGLSARMTREFVEYTIYRHDRTMPSITIEVAHGDDRNEVALQAIAEAMHDG